MRIWEYLLTLKFSDAFAGGFVAGVVEGKSLDESIDMGHWLASLSIRELGPQYVQSLLTKPLQHSINHHKESNRQQSSSNAESAFIPFILSSGILFILHFELTQILFPKVPFPQAKLQADAEERISLLELGRAWKRRSGFNNWVSTTKSACIV